MLMPVQAVLVRKPPQDFCKGVQMRGFQRSLKSYTLQDVSSTPEQQNPANEAAESFYNHLQMQNSLSPAA